MSPFRPRTLSALRKNSAVASLLLFAFLLRAFIPAGWMPGVTAEGGSEIVICTAQGMATLYLDEDGQPADENRDHDQPCAFGTLVSLTPPDGGKSEILQRISYRAPYISFAQTFVGQRDILGDAPARAPPLFS